MIRFKKKLKKDVINELEANIEGLTNELKSKGARNVRYINNIIYFDAGYSALQDSSPYSNLLCLVQYGMISIKMKGDKAEIEYELNYLMSFLLTIFGIISSSIMPILFLLFFKIKSVNFTRLFGYTFPIASLIFLLVYIGNVLITNIRFNEFLEHNLK